MKGFQRNLLLVVAFVVVTTAMTTTVGLVMGEAKIQSTDDYAAEFANVSGLKKGVDVRASGVSVGSVTRLELQDDATVMVHFNVPAGMELTAATAVRIRYANLTGDRYLDLSDDKSSDQALAPGATIPVSQTQAALDLDELYGGFQPLMQAMSPGEVNQLTDSLIQVTQGQSTAVSALLANVGSFTGTLAERDQLIGSVVTHLTTVVDAVDTRRTELAQLIDGVDDLLGGLAQDRQVIGASVEQVNTLAADMSQTLQGIRPGLLGTLTELGTVVETLGDDIDQLDDVLERYPGVMRRLHRGGAYGSYFNFYLCGVQVKATSGELQTDVFSPWLTSTEERCHF